MENLGKSIIHVFIIGSKGIPARYGGFETFVENLTVNKKSPNIIYHVSCMDNNERHFEYKGVNCFSVRVPINSAFGRFLHMDLVLKEIEQWIKKHPSEKVVIYILGCRVGPLLIPHAKKLHRAHALIYCNPDGLEWKRSKWNAIEKRFLRYCEKCLVENSDLAICDSVNIQKYIRNTYGNRVKETTYIAYGAYVQKSDCTEEKIQEWYHKHHLAKDQYYLIVGRFVPENNYETMIREFMQSSTKRDLVIITNARKDKFYEDLVEKTRFDKDSRIKFVGTVYDQQLLKRIREEAHGYLHGHEVGGTNPSLLEALASTKVNLLLDVGFNREVGRNSALYWTKEHGSLATLLEKVDTLDNEQIEKLDVMSLKRIQEGYNWENICSQYEKIFAIEKRKDENITCFDGAASISDRRA